MEKMDKDQTTERVTSHNRRHDRLIELFGMEIEHTEPGRAASP